MEKQSSPQKSTRSADTKKTTREGFASEGKLCGEKRNKAQHGHATVQLFGPVVESPATFGVDDFRGFGIWDIGATGSMGGYESLQELLDWHFKVHGEYNDVVVDPKKNI